MKRALLAVVVILLLIAIPVACSPNVRARLYSAALRDNGPRAPFEMAPGLYYVGASDIAVFAVRTADGLVLIDGGYAETAPQVLANLRTLGFEPRDVRLHLNTHAHMDHAAGLATLMRSTGAPLAASPKDADLLEAGGRGDFFLGDMMAYEPAAVSRRLTDGETLTIGGVPFTAHFTPGHTKGCTSWSFPLTVDGAQRQALVICSLSPLRFDLTDNPKYPEIVTDFEGTFAALRALPCDVFLGPHGRFFHLERKRAAQIAGASANPFIDPAGCRAYIDDGETKFRAALARQTKKPATGAAAGKPS